MAGNEFIEDNFIWIHDMVEPSLSPYIRKAYYKKEIDGFLRHITSTRKRIMVRKFDVFEYICDKKPQMYIYIKYDFKEEFDIHCLRRKRREVSLQEFKDKIQKEQPKPKRVRAEGEKRIGQIFGKLNKVINKLDDFDIRLTRLEETNKALVMKRSRIERYIVELCKVWVNPKIMEEIQREIK